MERLISRARRTRERPCVCDFRARRMASTRPIRRASGGRSHVQTRSISKVTSQKERRAIRIVRAAKGPSGYPPRILLSRRSLGPSSARHIRIGRCDRLIAAGDGLRVIDASIMPNITRGNTNAPTQAVARHATAMLVDDLKRT
ncbi:GMC oxidoreductase [Bradyrhizobium sp. DASA03007]|uniref:GMC oxidoreductase n=1 Tax=unclassified Bradyrhizobium TaxID=2631580 RepID=UPI003F6EC3A6